MKTSRYYYQISDRVTKEVLAEGYVTGGSKADCENAAKNIKREVGKRIGLNYAKDADRERLKLYLKAALEESTPVAAIRNSTGLSRAAFSRKYGIPVRTLEGWEYGKRQPPEWLVGILEKAIKYDQNEEEKTMTKYRVRDEYADSWYGGETDLEYIERCHTEGLLQEDIDHMVREYGKEILDQLEEI